MTAKLLSKLKSARIVIAFILHCLLLILSWHSENTVFMVFAAFIPIIYLLDQSGKTYNERLSIYILSFLSVFLWVYFTLYWIRPVSSNSHIIIVLLSSLVLLLPYILAYCSRFYLKKSLTVSSMSFLASWLIIELLHDFNVLGFPYLNLGHALAVYPESIQWYSYVGSIGGTIWILLLNYGLYSLFKKILQKRSAQMSLIRRVLILITIIILPLGLSRLILASSKPDTESSLNVIALHSAVDVFEYKYEVEPEVLLNEYLAITKENLNPSESNLVVWPENALTGDLYYNKLDSSKATKKIRQELCNMPGNYLITGAIVDEIVQAAEPGTYAPNILFDSAKQYYYKHYNAAVLISSDKTTNIKIKKRLVPLGEEIPKQRILSPIVSLFPNLADLNFSSHSAEFPAFTIGNDSYRTIPVICYGSAFSSFVAKEILRTESNFITVIMNEGWMRNEKTYKHFNWFSICRAIENKRYLIKSSNEGITALIDKNGMVLDYKIGHEAGILKGKLHANNEKSFFTKSYKYLHSVILILGLLFLISQYLRYFLTINRSEERTNKP